MRSLPLSLAALFLVMSASTAEAKKPPSQSQGNGVAPLLRSLQVIMNSAGPPAKTIDRDQGDDNASLRAIQVVCSKSTPAARRSAICPVSASPD
jgi:hypothetical protein